MSAMQHQFEEMLNMLFANETAAEQATTDWGQFTADNGYDGIDYSNVDMSEAVFNVSNELNIPAETQVVMLEQAPVPTGPPASAPSGSPQASVAAASTGGSAAAAAASGGSAAAAAAAAAPAAVPPQAVPANVNHYLQQVYEDNAVINEFDQSVELEIDGDVYDDVEIETNTANAIGDGSVAAADDIEGAVATGEGSTAIDGGVYDSTVQSNSGDGAVQVGGHNSGPINTGDNSGVIADGPVSGNVATGGSTINDQDVSSSGGGTAQGGVGNVNENVEVDTYGGDAVVGDNNATVQGEDNNANFGSGDQYTVEDSSVQDSNLNFGSGTQMDNDTTIYDDDYTETTLINEDNDLTVQVSADQTTQTEHVDNSINDSFNDQSEEFEIETEIEAEDSLVHVDEVEIED